MKFDFLENALDVADATHNLELRHQLESIDDELLPAPLKLEFQIRHHLALYFLEVILGKFQILEQVGHGVVTLQSIYLLAQEVVVRLGEIRRLLFGTLFLFDHG